MERASSILKSYPAHSKGGRSTNALLGTTNSDIQEKHLRRVTGYLRSLFEIRRWEKVCILLTGRSRWLGEWWGETKCRYCWDKKSIFHFSIKKKLFFPYWAEIVWLGIIPSCVLCKHTSLHTFLRALPQYILHFYTLSFSYQLWILPRKKWYVFFKKYYVYRAHCQEGLRLRETIWRQCDDYMIILWSHLRLKIIFPWIQSEENLPPGNNTKLLLAAAHPRLTQPPSYNFTSRKNIEMVSDLKWQ